MYILSQIFKTNEYISLTYVKQYLYLTIKNLMQLNQEDI